MSTRKAKPRSDETKDDLESRFVDEYLVDFDPYLAAIRAGIPRLQAKAKAKVLLSLATVQNELVKRVDAMAVSDIVTPQRILAGLMREAAASRFSMGKISALTTAHGILKDMRKQEKEDAEAAKAGKKGGVMLVPGTASLTDWEQAATEMQAELKKRVTE